MEKIKMAQKKKVMVIDDNKDNRDIICQMIEDFVEVIEVSGGEKAFELLIDKKIKVDLILLDLLLPNFDGYEIIKILKEKLNEIPPIYALTALPLNKEKTNIENAGFDGVITKPFSYTDFVKQIKNILE
mgnify:CR=1 FL=1